MVTAAKEPTKRDTQLAIADPNAPQRNAELEEAGVRYINACEAIRNGNDAKKAAYAEMKEIMRREMLDDYQMFDASKTLYMKQRDAEVEVKDTPTGSPDD